MKRPSFERIVVDTAKKGDVATAQLAAAEHIEQSRIERERHIEASHERAEPLRELEGAEIAAVETSAIPSAIPEEEPSREAEKRRRGRRGGVVAARKSPRRRALKPRRSKRRSFPRPGHSSASAMTKSASRTAKCSRTRACRNASWTKCMRGNSILTVWRTPESDRFCQSPRRRPRPLSELRTAIRNPEFELVARRKSWRPTSAISPMKSPTKVRADLPFNE